MTIPIVEYTCPLPGQVSNVQKCKFKLQNFNFFFISDSIDWCSVASLCLTLQQAHGMQPTMLLCPQDFLGKNTGVEQPFPSPRDLSDPGIEPTSSALPADSLPLSHLGSQAQIVLLHKYFYLSLQGEIEIKYFKSKHNTFVSNVTYSHEEFYSKYKCLKNKSELSCLKIISMVHYSCNYVYNIILFQFKIIIYKNGI